MPDKIGIDLDLHAKLSDLIGEYMLENLNKITSGDKESEQAIDTNARVSATLSYLNFSIMSGSPGANPMMPAFKSVIINDQKGGDDG